MGAQLAELFADLALAGHQRAHQPGLEIDAVLGHGVVEQALLRGQVQHVLQDLGGGVKGLFGDLALVRDGQVQDVQKGVAGNDHVQLLAQLVLAAKAQKALHVQRKGGVSLGGTGRCSR